MMSDKRKLHSILKAYIRGIADLIWELGKAFLGECFELK